MFIFKVLIIYTNTNIYIYIYVQYIKLKFTKSSHVIIILTGTPYTFLGNYLGHPVLSVETDWNTMYFPLKLMGTPCTSRGN